ncbi:MAG: DUF4153 domain-containing protein [Myxococcaceae bacterium]
MHTNAPSPSYPTFPEDSPGHRVPPRRAVSAAWPLAAVDCAARAAARPRRPRRTLGAALMLGALVELFFDGKPLGLGFPLFTLAFLGALLWVGGREAFSRAGANAFVAAPLVLFASMVFVRASPLLTALNVGASLFLIALIAHAWAGERLVSFGLWHYPAAAARAVGNALLLPPSIISAGVDFAAARLRLGPAVKPVLRAALITLPVLGVFGALLASADLMFASLLERALSFDPVGRAGELGTGAAVALGGAFLTAGLLGYALRRGPAPFAAARAALPHRQPLGFSEAFTLVAAVDALFLVFVGIQAAYLFGGVGGLQAQDFTYSEYARRGFFELLAVSVLTLLLLMALHRWVKVETRAREVLFHGASTAMVALVLVILASAVKRMALYEEVYGYTELRLYTHAFMFALAGVLSWRALTLWWRPELFPVGAFASALLLLAGLDLVNPDAFIARRNLERFAASRQLDAQYLAGLSADATPVLAGALGGLYPRDADVVRQSLANAEEQRQSRPWQSFHLARARAHAAFAPGE